MHPLNLSLRFLLEIAGLGGFGALAWQLADGWWRYVAVFAILALLVTLWGIFAVLDDASRSGNAPVPVSGIVRLGLELVILLGSGIALFSQVTAPSGPSLLPWSC